MLNATQQQELSDLLLIAQDARTDEQKAKIQMLNDAKSSGGGPINRPTIPNAPKQESYHGKVVMADFVNSTGKSKNGHNLYRIEVQRKDGTVQPYSLSQPFVDKAKCNTWMTPGTFVQVMEEIRIKNVTTWTDSQGSLQYHGDKMLANESRGFAGLTRSSETAYQGFIASQQHMEKLEQIEMEKGASIRAMDESLDKRVAKLTALKNAGAISKDVFDSTIQTMFSAM